MSHAAHRPNWPARAGIALASLLALTFSVALAVTIGEMCIPLDTALKALGKRHRHCFLIIAGVDRIGGGERRHRDLARRHRGDQCERDVVVEPDRLDDDLQPARDMAGNAVVDLPDVAAFGRLG